MSMKEILVHLDSTDRCLTRLDVAISLALVHQAHVTGVYATAHPFSAAARADSPPRGGEMETRFRQQASAAGISGDWISTDAAGLHAGVGERLLLQAYFADLVIVGQTDPAIGRSVPLDLPERLALGAGRPLLVIPRSGEFPRVGQRILLAWRGGRASARALNDAIHFLEQAEQVNLLMVNPDEHFDQQAASLCAYLGQHGVTARVDRLSADDVRAGDILLNQACDLGSDLVVMGGVAQKKLG
jgi:nucleotide-binding universal stress UspA family protein